MKRKFLQSIANLIIKRLEQSDNDYAFDFYYELGIWLDSYCVNQLDIYLE